MFSLIVIALLAVHFAGSYYSASNLTRTHAVSNYSNVNNTVAAKRLDFSSIVEQVYPSNGFILAAKWNNTAEKLLNKGALNLSFVSNSLIGAGEPLTNEQLKILNGASNTNITLNSSSALFTLYVLWAIGINNKADAINNGPIMNYGNPNQFASTGGYGHLGNLSIGNLSIINLSRAQQDEVNSIASNVYRPCCDNPAMFPDCNHGAAQLGLIELMVSQGRSTTEIYNALKEFNSFYYPQQYLDMAVLLNATQNKTWAEVAATLILGYNFSSASGSYAVQKQLMASNITIGTGGGSGGGCAV